MVSNLLLGSGIIPSQSYTKQKIPFFHHFSCDSNLGNYLFSMINFQFYLNLVLVSKLFLSLVLHKVSKPHPLSNLHTLLFLSSNFHKFSKSHTTLSLSFSHLIVKIYSFFLSFFHKINKISPLSLNLTAKNKQKNVYPRLPSLLRNSGSFNLFSQLSVSPISFSYFSFHVSPLQLLK